MNSSPLEAAFGALEDETAVELEALIASIRIEWDAAHEERVETVVEALN